MEAVLHVLKPRRQFIILFAVAVGVLAGALSLLQPLKYSATVRLLITQQAAFTLDPYTAIRSTELIAENLGQVVATSSFLDRVLESGYKVDANYFKHAREAQRRALWSNTVSTSIARGTGLLNISVYHPSRDEAKRIVSAIAFLLSSQGSDYIGREITVRLVDSPLISRFPVKPNIFLNALTGIFVGATLGGAWVWVDHRRRKHRGHLV